MTEETPKQTEQAPGLGHNNPPEETHHEDGTPRSIEELLAASQAEIIAKVEPIAERANKLPRSIDSEDDLNKVTPVVLDAKALVRDLEAARKAAKQPYIDGGKAVDGFFNPVKDRIGRIVSVFEDLASDFQRRKIEAERAARAEEARKAEQRAQKAREDAEKAKRADTREKRLDAADQAQVEADRAAASVTQTNAQLGKVSGSGGTASARTHWTFAIEDFDKLDLNAIRHFIPRDAIEQGLRAYVKIQKGSAKMDGVRFYEDVKTSFRR